MCGKDAGLSSSSSDQSALTSELSCHIHGFSGAQTRAPHEPSRRENEALQSQYLIRPKFMAESCIYGRFVLQWSSSQPQAFFTARSGFVWVIGLHYGAGCSFFNLYLGRGRGGLFSCRRRRTWNLCSQSTEFVQRPSSESRDVIRFLLQLSQAPLTLSLYTPPAVQVFCARVSLD